MQNSAVRLKAIKTGGNSLNPPASMTLNLLSGAISSLVTFTRATTATVTDWEGLIKNTKSGEARFDGMRRVGNLLTYSQDFSNAAWPKANATVTADAVAAPDGTLTADSLFDTAATSIHSLDFGPFPANTYTLSIYAKAGTLNYVGLFALSSTSGIFFNLSNGTLASNIFSAPISSAIQSVGNGWYRCSITVKPTASDVFKIILSYNGISFSYLGAGKNVYIWGAQLENVTGQTNQNPSEYVSTNVLSAPYQGAAVDGVQYFPYTNPNCIINNAITQIPTIAINSSNSKFAYNCTASGDYFSTPSATANQITGDISMLVQVALDDWTPATVQTLVAKDGVTSQRSYAFNVQTSGALRLNYSLDGTTITSITSTASTGFTDGTVHFVGVQREAATGIVRFYTSEDGTTFTQLGTQQTGTAGNLFNSTTPVQFGNLSSLAFELNGKIYDSHIYTGLKFSGNTLGSELVVNGDFSQGTTGWSVASGSLVVNSGVATITNTSAAEASLTIQNLTPNSWFYISADISALNLTGTVYFVTPTGSNVPNIPRSGAGKLQGYFYSGTGTAARIAVGITTLGASFSVDNISIVQVTPNTATASSTMVVDFDPSDWTSGTSWVGPETGETWTINGNAKIYQGLWDAVGPKSLLIEEARTNLLTYSADYSNVAWNKENVTVSAVTTVLPDGTSNANKVIDTAVLGFHRVYSGLISGISATSYTFSVYAKYAGRRWLALQISGSTYFDLVNGVVGSSTSGSTGTITPVGNGWYRCTTTRTLLAGLTTTEIFLANADNGANYTGDGTSGVYLWGAQLEQGAFATSYIPTTSAQVTRNADQASMTGTNFSSWYNASAGTLYVDFDLLASVNNLGIYSINLTSSALNNRMDFRTSGANNTAAGVALNSASVTFLSVIGINQKLISAYAVTDSAATKNGLAVTSYSLATMPTVDRLLIGQLDTGSNQLNGHIRTIRYYSQRLSNTTLQSLTA